MELGLDVIDGGPGGGDDAEVTAAMVSAIAMARSWRLKTSLVGRVWRVGSRQDPGDGNF